MTLLNMTLYDRLLYPKNLCQLSCGFVTCCLTESATGHGGVVKAHSLHCEDNLIILILNS